MNYKISIIRYICIYIVIIDLNMMKLKTNVSFIKDNKPRLYINQNIVIKIGYWCNDINNAYF